MDINDIPRDVTALQALTTAERYKLFLQLQVEGMSDEVNNRFLNSTTKQQAEHLLTLLQSYDIENDAGYRVESIALPKRSKDHRTNEKRMAKFADKIEYALNELNATCHRVNVVHFENHGVLVVGLRPPPSHLMPFPPGMIPGVFARMGSPSGGQESKSAASKLDGEDRQRFMAMCNHAFTLVSTTADERALDKNLDEFVDSAMSGIGAELTKSYIDELNRLESEHAITHDHDSECELGKMFAKMKKSLEKRVLLATN